MMTKLVWLLQALLSVCDPVSDLSLPQPFTGMLRISLISRLSSTQIPEIVLCKAKTILIISAHPAATASAWSSHRPTHNWVHILPKFPYFLLIRPST